MYDDDSYEINQRSKGNFAPVYKYVNVFIDQRFTVTGF